MARAATEMENWMINKIDSKIMYCSVRGVNTLSYTSTRSFLTFLNAPKKPKTPMRSINTPVATTPPKMDKLDTYDPVLAQAATAITIIPHILTLVSTKQQQFFTNHVEAV